MKLKTVKRTSERRNDAKKFRREGMVPAVLYVRGKPSETIAVDESELQSLLRSVQKGRLSTTKFALAVEGGGNRHAIIKDIQYHPTTYKVIHLDFEELLDDIKIKVNVPIEFTGVVDCIGIKLGGVLRQVIRSLKVQCLPKDMPEHLEMDIRAMAIKEARKLKDLNIPSSIKPLANLEEVCVVIAKR
jgi:large subunit ribosomal protein L25